jgi:SAM-dependent methyltransferase
MHLHTLRRALTRLSRATSSLQQLQYILAAHLGNNVPPSARVVDYGIGTGTNLYYYPPGTAMVYGVGEDADPGLLLTVGGAAGVTVSAQKGPLTSRLALEAGSMDAVVSVNALGQQGEEAAVREALTEAARVTRPGAPLVFFESGAGGARLTAALERSEAWTDVRYDDRWFSYALAPHAIGVATRTSGRVSSGSGSGSAAAGGGVKSSGRAAAAEAFAAKSGKADAPAAAPSKGFGGGAAAAEAAPPAVGAGGGAAPGAPPPAAGAAKGKKAPKRGR